MFYYVNNEVIHTEISDDRNLGNDQITKFLWLRSVTYPAHTTTFFLRSSLVAFSCSCVQRTSNLPQVFLDKFDYFVRVYSIN